MKLAFPPRFAPLVIVFAAALAGCLRSTPARFYTLTPVARREARAPLPEEAGRISIGVTPVQIPDYLDRPQIVTRNGGNSVKVAEFERWAGSIGENITAVVAENLGALLGSDRVFSYPGIAGAKYDYTLTVQLLRLDIVPGDHVFLEARWAIDPAGQGRAGALIRLAAFSERLSDDRYETMAAGISRTLGSLSREIAGEIDKRRRGAGAGAGADHPRINGEDND
jgi:uncharacterized protein